MGGNFFSMKLFMSKFGYFFAGDFGAWKNVSKTILMENNFFLTILFISKYICMYLMCVNKQIQQSFLFYSSMFICWNEMKMHTENEK